MTCIKCGKELEEGYRKAHCPECVAAWVAKQKEQAAANGMEILDLTPKDYVDEDADEEKGGWPNPMPRMKDTMKPEDLDDDGVMWLVEAIFDGALKEISRTYEAWVKEAMNQSKDSAIYRAETAYNFATRILCSPLFGALSSSDPNDLLEAIWKDVNRRMFMGSARLEKLVKGRMRKARENMQKPKEEGKRVRKG